VDDFDMKITHVIRAEEWISSTQKHVLLYKAFGWDPPEFVHMPLLRNPNHSKISKRNNPTSIFYYRDIGILPEAFLNFLGTLGVRLPIGDGAHVILSNLRAVKISQHRFEDDANADGQPGDFCDAFFFELTYRIKLTGFSCVGRKRLQRVKKVMWHITSNNCNETRGFRMKSSCFCLRNLE